LKVSLEGGVTHVGGEETAVGRIIDSKTYLVKENESV
jgi:hypothetical protein